jgi:aryl-alcohol dehydrogenase-like predicted oxidoreductase
MAGIFKRSSGSMRLLNLRAGRWVSLSLNWLLHPTAADCIILGLSSMEQLNQNLAAGGDGPLPEDVVKSCNRAARNR